MSDCTCGDAAAVDYYVALFGEIMRFARGVEPDAAAGFGQHRVQLRQHLARLDMPFVGKEQGFAKSAIKRRLEPGDAVGVEPLIAAG